MQRSLAGPCWLLLWWMRQPGINQQTRSVIDTMQAAAIARMTITMMLTVTAMLSLVLFSTSGSHLLVTSCITQVRRAWRFHVLEREVKFTAKVHQIYIRDLVVWHFVKTIIDTAMWLGLAVESSIPENLLCRLKGGIEIVGICACIWVDDKQCPLPFYQNPPHIGLQVW